MARRSSNPESPPPPREVELSLFGPGKGECVVLHVGNNEWIVVDSCMSEDAETPIAIAYLKSLGLDPSSCVKLVALTHWHDDHIKGAASTLREASAATFACSVALLSKDFISLVHSGDQIRLVGQTSGVREFADILDELDRRGARGGPGVWAQEGTVLYRSSDQAAKLIALSPSPQTITNAARVIGSLIPTVGAAKNPVPRVTPNETSVAMLLEFGELSFLLGADLEVHSDVRCGWAAVVNSANRPNVPAIAFKIPHHGSPNGDYPDAWSNMLVPQPVAAIAPYAGGQTPRPSADDIARIKSQTKSLHCTVGNLAWAPPRRRGSDKTINEVASSRRAVRSRPGHVRLRVPFGGNVNSIRVEEFWGAGEL